MRHPIFLRELAREDAADRQITAAIAIDDACEAPKQARPGGGTSHRVLLRLEVEEHRIYGPDGASRSLRAGRYLSAETMAFRKPGLFQHHRLARAQIVRMAFKPLQRSFEAVEQPRRPLSFSAGGLRCDLEDADAVRQYPLRRIHGLRGEAADICRHRAEGLLDPQPFRPSYPREPCKWCCR
ncbi:hypothetical protein [Rhodovulum sulfidophilum]|uniref:hypothetical protein n=1 Tax=Rhodovulum sulfidophilum TaxID=35806 RepID=UPI001921D83C|nr:hypothetical protein [Rhodovulum sulfidophilum]MBL3551415.1 hypothetical protein [Rhodovulum sulfidophilum]